MRLLEKQKQKQFLQKIKGQEKVYQGLTSINKPKNILNLNKYTHTKIRYVY